MDIRKTVEKEDRDNDRTIHAGSTDVPPEKRVFAAHLLLCKILSYLTVKQMKVVRFVCSIFNRAILELLGKPGFVPLEGIFYPADESSKLKMCIFNVKLEMATLEWQLPDLIAVIKSSNHFHCQDFRFYNASIREPCLREFFFLYGSRIKRLFLGVHNRWEQNPEIYPTPEEFFTILRAIPNIEHLELTSIPFTEKWKKGNVPENIHKGKGSNEPNENNDLSTSFSLLPNLKVLKLSYNVPEWLFLTLVKSPKLERVRQKGLNGGCYHINRTNKLHLMKNITVRDLRLGNFYRIMSMHPNVSLSKIQVFPYECRKDSSLRQILSQLFKSNQYTLKSVQLHPLGNIPQLEIPQLPNVLKLEIVNIHDPTEEKLFPAKMDMNNVFPNLKSLIINIWPVDPFGYHPHFAPIHEYFIDLCHSPMPKVKFLCFVCDPLIGIMYPSDFMEFFSKLCPRVTSADFRKIRSFTPESGDIWKFFGKLIYLKLSLNVSTFRSRGPNFPEYPEHTLHSIDSFFTGISVDNLKLLATSKVVGNAHQEERIQKMRTHPSIVLLKDLKHLEISVYGNKCRMEERKPFVPTLTDASRHYAFSHELNLSFSLHFEDRRELLDWKQVTKSLLTKPCL